MIPVRLTEQGYNVMKWILKKGVLQLFLGCALVALKTGTAIAQEAEAGQSAFVSGFEATDPSLHRPAKGSYFEPFDEAIPHLVLGGQVNFRPEGIAGLRIFLADGKFTYINQGDANKVRRDNIHWVRYPNETSISRTDSSVISVTVTSTGEGRYGNGILVGDGRVGNYLLFTVNNEGHYILFERKGGKALIAHSAPDAAITANAANRLSHKWRGDRLAFFANDQLVVEVPADRKRLKGIGIAVFGKGRFTFDDLEISRSHTVGDG